jgi:hypothetical protein
MNSLCRVRAAAVEHEPACFNGAVSSAMSFYRRAGDTRSTSRVFKLANSHPTAATHWTDVLQTPRVFNVYIPANEAEAAAVLDDVGTGAGAGAGADAGADAGSPVTVTKTDLKQPLRAQQWYTQHTTPLSSPLI